MELSIIIVNYKTPSLVIDCIGSIYKNTKSPSYEIIVVDNNSSDNSREQIMTAFPEVRWIQMDYNAGFARANNEGIRQSSGEIVLLLNSDTVVSDNAIEACYYAFKESRYVACGLQLLNPDGSPQISGNYFMKGGLNHLLGLPYLGQFLKFLANLLHVKKPNVAEAKGTEEVDWINGAFLMVKRSAIDQAGTLDEDFFLYAEETEWCSRLRKLGILAIYGQYRIVHLVAASTNETFGSSGQSYLKLFDQKGLQIMVSNSIRVRKQFGKGWFLIHVFFYFLGIVFFFFGLVFSYIFSGKNRKYNWENFIGYTRNVVNLAGLTPTILRNRPHFYKML
jgi:GT2 family glycosyltransferase